MVRIDELVGAFVAACGAGVLVAAWWATLTGAF